MNVYSLPFLFIFISAIFSHYYNAFCADDDGMAKEGSRQLEAGPAEEFHRHVIVWPRVTPARSRRHINNGSHGDKIISLNLNGKDLHIELHPNRELFGASYFEKYQSSEGGYVVKNSSDLVTNCHYQGKIRGVPESWAALSICDGITGVIYDGNEMQYLEKSNHDRYSHYLYSHSDLKPRNLTCGYSGQDLDPVSLFSNLSRFRRSSGGVRGPYDGNQKSRFVELVFVVDNKEYKTYGEDENKLYKRCKDIANIMNALYTPLNIFIALVGVVIWSEVDEIMLVNKGDVTLTKFLNYRRDTLLDQHPNDNAQLLTGITFEGGVVGKALKGPICTSEFSGGVNMDHSSVVGLVATTVAHELGHNFGMEHDVDECSCPKERCIMAASSSSVSPTVWSSCSLEYLALSFEHGMDYCLRNKPTALFGPECGNNFVEAGEECDCGLEEFCDNKCCNASTCMLHRNATCATGECCDLDTCQPKKVATLCREPEHECDLPEYCSGQSEYCPDNSYKQDGSMCKEGEAYCYGGSCQTHTDQCRLLWGPSGNNSDFRCYKQNVKGNRHGNCRYYRRNQTYVACQAEDIECGMLHCVHLNERLEFGIESVALLSHSFINQNGKVLPCRNAIVDLGRDQMDPGLAPNGAKCGNERMCVNQRCVPVSSVFLKHCPHNCSGNGVCNNNGHCHCRSGFGPPFCDVPGPGGSIDSGPASDPNALGPFVIALYVIFLGIFPMVVLVLCCYFQLRPGFLFPRMQRKEPSTTDTNTRSQSSRLQVNKPGLISKRDITGPQEAKVPDLHSTLLPILNKDDESNHTTISATKGYRLTPFSKTSNDDSPSPYNAIYTNMIQWKSKDVEANGDLRPCLPSERRENADNLDNAQAVTYVVSSNDSSFCSMNPASEDGEDFNVISEVEVKVKGDSQFGTLSKLKKLLSGTVKTKSDPGSPVVGKTTGSMMNDKRLRIDRDSLRNLNISNPIPQKEIELSKNVELVPIVTASSTTLAHNPVTTRESVAKKPENRVSWTSGSALSSVPNGVFPRSEATFNSTDQSASPKRFHSLRAKRPQSINVTRPKSPPPRPPNPTLPSSLYQNIPGIKENEYCYDDCLNMDERLGGNIYATIDEETPTDLPATLYSTPNKSKAPRPDNPGPTGDNNGGLLSEILTELQFRTSDTPPVLYSNVPDPTPCSAVQSPTEIIPNTSTVSAKRAVFEGNAKLNDSSKTSPTVPLLSSKAPCVAATTTSPITNTPQVIKDTISGNAAAEKGTSEEPKKNDQLKGIKAPKANVKTTNSLVSKKSPSPPKVKEVTAGKPTIVNKSNSMSQPAASIVAAQNRLTAETSKPIGKPAANRAKGKEEAAKTNVKRATPQTKPTAKGTINKTADVQKKVPAKTTAPTGKSNPKDRPSKPSANAAGQKKPAKA